MESRSQKTVKNIAFSLSSNIITQLLHFVVRTVFIYTLGVSYNGLDGLFSNILTMLSLADLGMGVAMAHTYYKPLADKDENKINALTALYKKIYFVVGMIVFLAGMTLMPFLPKLIKDIDKVEALGINVRFIFFWYVLNSAVSYMFAAYKQTLLIADQKQYIVKRIYMYFALITSVLQIAALIAFKSSPFTYYVYLICNIAFQILRNLYIAHKCDSMFPYIKIKNKAIDLKDEINKLLKDIYSLFLYRICIVILNGTDNIIIAKFVSGGIASIGSYSNYSFFISAVNSVLTQVFESVTASVGNLIAEIKGGNLAKGDEKVYKAYNALHFANFWLFGVCSVTLWVMLDPFVRLWLGKSDIVFLSPAVVFVLIANFYIVGIQLSTTAFRNAYGLFRQGRYRPVFMAIINIVVSLWLVRDYGILGVFVGTLISRVSTVVWFDPYVVHKYGLGKSVVPFLVKLVLRTVLLIGMGVGMKYVLDFMPTGNLWWLVLRAFIAFGGANLILFAIYFKTENFKFIKVRLIGLLKKFKR